MSVEQRVRDALHTDAARMQVPEHPPIAEFEQRRRRGVSLWPLGVAVAAAAVVGVLVLVAPIPGLQVEFFDSEPDAPPHHHPPGDGPRP